MRAADIPASVEVKNLYGETLNIGGLGKVLPFATTTLKLGHLADHLKVAAYKAIRNAVRSKVLKVLSPGFDMGTTAVVGAKAKDSLTSPAPETKRTHTEKSDVQLDSLVPEKPAPEAPAAPAAPAAPEEPKNPAPGARVVTEDDASEAEAEAEAEAAAEAEALAAAEKEEAEAAKAAELPSLSEASEDATEDATDTPSESEDVSSEDTDEQAPTETPKTSGVAGLSDL